MSDILCLYYSRTGTTRSVMEQIADLLGAELVELTDGKDRSGAAGYIASGLDAMKKTPDALQPFETKKPLGEYGEVILATPVWAGRCSSIIRSFLIARGKELPERVSYVITHMGETPYEKVYTQMDQYLSTPHRLGLSLQPKADDRHNKVYDFVRALTGEAVPEPEADQDAKTEETPKAPKAQQEPEAPKAQQEQETAKAPVAPKAQQEMETAEAQQESEAPGVPEARQEPETVEVQSGAPKEQPKQKPQKKKKKGKKKKQKAQETKADAK